MAAGFGDVVAVLSRPAASPAGVGATWRVAMAGRDRTVVSIVDVTVVAAATPDAAPIVEAGNASTFRADSSGTVTVFALAGGAEGTALAVGSLTDGLSFGLWAGSAPVFSCLPAAGAPGDCAWQTDLTVPLRQHVRMSAWDWTRFPGFGWPWVSRLYAGPAGSPGPDDPSQAFSNRPTYTGLSLTIAEDRSGVLYALEDGLGRDAAGRLRIVNASVQLGAGSAYDAGALRPAIAVACLYGASDDIGVVVSYVQPVNAGLARSRWALHQVVIGPRVSEAVANEFSPGVLERWDEQRQCRWGLSMSADGLLLAVPTDAKLLSGTADGFIPLAAYSAIGGIQLWRRGADTAGRWAFLQSLLPTHYRQRELGYGTSGTAFLGGTIAVAARDYFGSNIGAFDGVPRGGTPRRGASPTTARSPWARAAVPLAPPSPARPIRSRPMIGSSWASPCASAAAAACTSSCGPSRALTVRRSSRGCECRSSSRARSLAGWGRHTRRATGRPRRSRAALV